MGAPLGSDLTYTTADQAAAEFGVDFNGLLRMIDDGRITKPSRYIRGVPEWDKPSAWKGCSREGTVYIVGFAGYVKIGFTSDRLEYRLSGIQTGCPEKIEVVREIPGNCAMEAALHRRFAKLRTYGEWFRREGDLAAWIESGCK